MRHDGRLRAQYRSEMRQAGQKCGRPSWSQVFETQEHDCARTANFSCELSLFKTMRKASKQAGKSHLEAFAAVCLFVWSFRRVHKYPRSIHSDLQHHMLGSTSFDWCFRSYRRSSQQSSTQSSSNSSTPILSAREKVVELYDSLTRFSHFRPSLGHIP
jgi:hypothetical protein